jgi:hypothetical protein
MKRDALSSTQPRGLIEDWGAPSTQARTSRARGHRRTNPSPSRIPMSMDNAVCTRLGYVGATATSSTSLGDVNAFGGKG